MNVDEAMWKLKLVISFEETFTRIRFVNHQREIKDLLVNQLRAKLKLLADKSVS